MSNTVVRTNVMSLNSHRNLGIVSNQQSRASQRLSSGFRINSAADDAAGLGISEKMRSQIRGLDQASRNAQDGISLIQTAEGAMSVINEMVARIRELVVQASNDTNAHSEGNLAQSDRLRIQDEINQLMDEIDATRDRTQFNTRNLIDGSLGSGAAGGAGGAALAGDAITGFAALINNAGSFHVDGGGNTFQNTGGGLVAMGALAAGFTLRDGVSAVDFNVFMNDLVNRTIDQVFNVAAHNGNVDSAVSAWMSERGHTSLGTSWTLNDAGAGGIAARAALAEALAEADISRVVQAPGPWSFTANQITFNFERSGLHTGSTALANATAAATAAIASFFDDNSGTGLNNIANFLMDVAAVAGMPPGDLATFLGAMVGTMDFEITQAGADLRAQMVAAINAAVSPFITGAAAGGAGNPLWFHIGANAGQGIHLSIEDVGTASLNQVGLRSPANIATGFTFADLRTQTTQAGVATGDGVSIERGEQINQFLVAIDEALSHVTAQRSNLGAMQNRLEFTIESLDISSENLSAANSRIRDADMAQEMMRLTQANVLQQAAISMLAQANQAPQSILQLLG